MGDFVALTIAKQEEAVEWSHLLPVVIRIADTFALIPSISENNDLLSKN